MPQTTADLLRAIKRRGVIPESQTKFTDSDILEVATDVVRSEIMPMLVQLNEDYFTFIKDVSINSRTEIPLPTRVSGSVLKNVYHTDGTDEVEMRRFSSSERVQKDGYPYGYYLGWNSIHLLDDTLNGTLKFHFYIEAGKLVSTTSACRVTGFDADTGVVDVAVLPDTFTGGVEVDFIKGRSPYEYLSLEAEVSSSDSGAPSVTFTSLPSTLEIGDYICLKGESAIVQLPDAFHSVLVEQTSIDLLMSIGDDVSKFQQRLDKKIANMIEFASPRVKHDEKKIIAPGGVGGGFIT